ncbi:MAG: hypothetical protein E7360_06980 [Clostridiales bacterium]|nr:hypothetical protein [Clostridiales bacterium]
MKACSFFGHRDFEPTIEIEEKVYAIIENLIVEKGVKRFLFGSRSNFDAFCHNIVTDLQSKYPEIVRVAYLCRHEGGCLVGQGKDQEEWLRKFAHIDVKVQEYEEIKRSDRVDSAGRASYIERNELMIGDSDYCVFFVQERRGKKSGSLIAFDYANRKQKEVLNVYAHNI